MNLEQIVSLDQQYYFNTFGRRTPVAFERGKGIRLYDTQGKEYRDFMAGIAVTALGHSHPKFVAALTDQLAKLVHTSSLYYVENQARLAQKLVECSVADRVFFANSGAEANEGAIKLAKIYHSKKGTGRYEIITLVNSFHGRTLTTVAATGQEKYQKPYRPLAPGFLHVPINDLTALNAAVTDKTAAVMLELIQGESGVHPVDADYIKAVRELCSANDILLIVDEVQTGMGRTGKLFAYEQYGIEPDVFTLAKALGNGVPIGALCAKQFAADAFEPGDHGTTFGGNPLATRAGLCVLETLREEGLVQNAADTGAYFKTRLEELSALCPCEVRGMGLMLGVEFETLDAKELQGTLFDRGYLVGAVGNRVLRLLPPLVVAKQDVDEFVDTLRGLVAQRV